MTGGEIALLAGAGLVGLVVVYKIGRAQAVVPTTNPLGTGSAGVAGAAPGSTIGTGTSAAGRLGAQILTGSSSISASSAAKGALATAVLGPSYEIYNAGKALVGFL